MARIGLWLRQAYPCSVQRIRSNISSIRQSEKAGTTSILIGTVVLVITAILFQIIAGRSLEPARFAPIGIIWTIQFIVTSVLLLPVQNLITRQLALAAGSDEYLRPERKRVMVVFGGAVVIGTAFAALTLDQFFFGDRRFAMITLVILIGRGLVSLARGFLAGRRRFFAFGESLAAEGIALLATGLIAAAWQPTTLAFAACIAIAPFATLLVRPFSRSPVLNSPVTRPIVEDVYAHPRGFLEYLIVATAASQIVLASAPVVVGLIGGSAVAVSIVFATFTLFRGPVTSAYNLVARVLPDFTDMVRDGRSAVIRTWSRRITVGGATLAAIGFAGGWSLGPSVVSILFGTDFRPSNEMAAFVGAGVGAALGTLFVGQIYIAQGRTRSLAARWGISLGVAIVTVYVAFGPPELQVAIGFATGEVAALLLLHLGSIAERHPADSSQPPIETEDG